jgi:hypothetical protein
VKTPGENLKAENGRQRALWKLLGRWSRDGPIDLVTGENRPAHEDSAISQQVEK